MKFIYEYSAEVYLLDGTSQGLQIVTGRVASNADIRYTIGVADVERQILLQLQFKYMVCYIIEIKEIGGIL